ncbi:hypothetical protein Gpo141_00009019 [Globisporangium polare]
MLRKILFVSAALVALFAVDQTQALCKVKGSEVGAESNGTANNKIQAAPTKRLTNKLLFDVVSKKKNATSYDADEEADLNA